MRGAYVDFRNYGRPDEVASNLSAFLSVLPERNFSLEGPLKPDRQSWLTSLEQDIRRAFTNKDSAQLKFVFGSEMEGNLDARDLEEMRRSIFSQFFKAEHTSKTFKGKAWEHLLKTSEMFDGTNERIQALCSSARTLEICGEPLSVEACKSLANQKHPSLSFPWISSFIELHAARTKTAPDAASIEKYYMLARDIPSRYDQDRIRVGSDFLRVLSNFADVSCKEGEMPEDLALAKFGVMVIPFLRYVENQSKRAPEIKKVLDCITDACGRTKAGDWTKAQCQVISSAGSQLFELEGWDPVAKGRQDWTGILPERLESIRDQLFIEYGKGNNWPVDAVQAFVNAVSKAIEDIPTRIEMGAWERGI